MNSQIRLHTKEQLDDLSLSGITLQKTLSSLRLINKLFGNHKQLYKSILAYCLHSEKASVHIVDLGCGGGDSIHTIAYKLHKKGIKASFTGIDGNKQSIKYATSKYNHYENIHFIAKNILDENFTVPQCDILISSHFMYHFRDDALIHFLKKTKKVDHIIFSELYRSKMAYYLFKFSSFILPISQTAKKDGLLAIKRAFSIQELKDILLKSEVKKFVVLKKPWFRTVTKIDL
ncbi:methyltransferase domain-containing protein [Aquimarina sp. RZ0]|uniref:methyltransferase domain-containing protein n=1 Tax=Aquimarina sp. RZ0 TaxID=2607730 RepID=UPI00165F7DE9|nr:methyltransferase domain-containing protein [Aquimarina sp. RZ0]